MEVIRRYNRRGRGFEDNGQIYYRKKYNKTQENEASQPQTALKSLEGWILFITNLHEETTEDDIKEAFSEFGDVKNINLNLDRRTGFVKGYALVEYESFEQAEAAVEGFNNGQLLGVPIRVNWCFTDR